MGKIHITESQAKLWEQRKRQSSAMPRIKKKSEDLPENIEKNKIMDFLATRGWTVSRQVRGLFKRADGGQPFVLGLKGQCDLRAHRPIFPGGKRLDATKTAVPQLYFEFEAKAPGAKPRPDQLQYMRQLSATGTPAFWADSYEAFLVKYRAYKFEAWF